MGLPDSIYDRRFDLVLKKFRDGLTDSEERELAKIRRKLDRHDMAECNMAHLNKDYNNE